MSTTPQRYPKIVMFSDDFTKILLAKRKNGNTASKAYTFIGKDSSPEESDVMQELKRKKREELGTECFVRLFVDGSAEVDDKQDGKVVPHSYHLGIFMGGTIKLDPAYSDYSWIRLEELEKNRIPKALSRTAERMYENRSLILR